MPIYNNILAGSSGQGGYEIKQSLRFNDDDSAYLSRTPASAGNRKTWTWSGWVKHSTVGSDYWENVFGAKTDLNNYAYIVFEADVLRFFNYVSGSQNGQTSTSAPLYRDPSAWRHVVIAWDTTQATDTNRLKIYINGEQLSLPATVNYPSLNHDGIINSATPHYIGGQINGEFDGYLAEMNFIDGTALDASSFGETNLLTNQWIPKKYVGTYGTNGFYLDFGNSGSLGADSSGNGNNFTPTNLAATDQVLDSPTNNFATLNSLAPDTTGSTAHSFSEGNLKVSTSSNNWWNAFGTIGLPSGKWYFEYCAVGSGTVDQNVGVTVSDWYRGSGGGIDTAGAYSLYSTSGGVGQLYTDGSYVNNGSSWAWTWGDIVNFAIDVDTGKIWYGINGTWLGSGNPASGTNQAHTVSATNLAKTLLPAFSGYHTGGTPVINFGQDSSFAGNKTAQGNTDANGIGDFYYAPPSGYLALCEDNLPDPSIADPTAYFNTVLYTGTGSAANVDVGFQPDWIWFKERNGTNSHQLYDAIRGSDLALFSNTTSAEYDYSQHPSGDLAPSFTSNGFQTPSVTNNGINASGQNYVAWNWKANGSGSSNTDGTITSTVSANTTAGFSIVSYTGNGTNGATVGHGLSQKPDLVIYKARSQATHDWIVYSSPLGATKRLKLNLTDAESTSSSQFNDTEPTSSVVTLGTFNNINQSSETFIAYCFHSVEGYSKIGSYTGNSSADGTFVYTGFLPAFIMIKKYTSADDWLIHDNKRTDYGTDSNPIDDYLRPNSSAVEGDDGPSVDFVSNGFKWRINSGVRNQSGQTYIYMAFAESPFKYSNAR